MTRYVEGEDRSQATLFPERLDEYIAADNPVRVVDVFVDELDLQKLDFDGMQPEVTGRPAYHPGTLLKIYIYGYLNRIQSSRRLERETQRNVELIWLTGRLMPDFKTIADFRKDNGKAIRQVCREFVLLCRSLSLFSDAIVAIDGSKFKAVNNRDKNFTDRKLKARTQQLEESITRYLAELDRADREPAAVTEVRVAHLQDKVAAVRAQMRRLEQIGQQMAKAPDGQISLTDPDARSMATSGRGTGIVGYNVQTAVDDEAPALLPAPRPRPAGCGVAPVPAGGGAVPARAQCGCRSCGTDRGGGLHPPLRLRAQSAPALSLCGT